METDQPTQRSPQVENAQRLLADKGHDVGVFGMRVAAGRSGIAIGFPQDPMVHVSWLVLGGLVVLAVVARSRRS
jgi:hypothetical protein